METQGRAKFLEYSPKNGFKMYCYTFFSSEKSFELHFCFPLGLFALFPNDIKSHFLVTQHVKMKNSGYSCKFGPHMLHLYVDYVIHMIVYVVALILLIYSFFCHYLAWLFFYLLN